jgi:feruloyl-CoA synthase
VVITGHERDEIGVLVFPDLEACRLNGALADATPAEIISDLEVRALFRDRLTLAADAATGSSNRVARAMLLHEPPSLDGNELTDKGSINQRAVLIRRAALVEALYGDQFADFIIYTSDRR